MNASTANSSGGIGCRVVLWRRIASSAAHAASASGHRQRFEATENFWRVIEEHFVDDVCFRARPSSLTAGFNDGGEAAAFTEQGDNVADIDAAARSIESADFDATGFERFTAFGRGGGSGRDQQIVVRRLCTRREAGEMRRVESRTMRRSGRARGSSLRSLSKGLSESTVPMPVIMASVAWAKNLNVGAGAFAGNPAGVVFGRGDFAIEGERALERDKRLAGAQ